MALDIKTIKRYRDYRYKNDCSKNQEKERERYREYYPNNADSEKARIKQHCMNKRTI